MPLITQCIGLSGTRKLHADPVGERRLEPVEQSAAAGQHDAAADHVVGDLRGQVLERALDELGHLRHRHGERFGHVAVAQHDGLEPSLLEVAALDMDLDLAAVGLCQRAAASILMRSALLSPMTSPCWRRT